MAIRKTKRRTKRSFRKRTLCGKSRVGGHRSIIQKVTRRKRRHRTSRRRGRVSGRRRRSIRRRIMRGGDSKNSSEKTCEGGKVWTQEHGCVNQMICKNKECNWTNNTCDCKNKKLKSSNPKGQKITLRSR